MTLIGHEVVAKTNKKLKRQNVVSNYSMMLGMGPELVQCV